MATFKLVINDPETGRSYQVERSWEECSFLIGKRIGFRFAGDLIGLPGYELVITGGTDKDGFPMRGDLPGTGRKRILVSKETGFHERKRVRKKIKKIRGLRRRKTFRGNVIADDLAQLNCVVVRKGPQPLEELLGKKEATSSAEKSK